jgi:hypothetical protein
MTGGIEFPGPALASHLGWRISYLIHAPMSPERFQTEDVAAVMQKKKILGVTGRYVVAAIGSETTLKIRQKASCSFIRA